MDDRLDTDHNTNYLRDTNLDQHNPISINHPKRKNDLRHTLKLKCNENNRLWISEAVLVCSMKRICTLSGNPGNNLRNWYGAKTYIFLKTPNISSSTNTEYQLLMSDKFWLLRILKFPYFNDCFLIHSSMVYGASPETTPRTSHFLIPKAIRNTCKLCLVPWGYSLAPNVAMKHLKDGSEQAADELRQPCKSTTILVRLRVID